MLKVSYCSFTSLVMSTGVQCERWGRFTVRRLSKNSLSGGCILDLRRLLRLLNIHWLCSVVHPLDSPGHISLDAGRKPSWIQRQFQGQVFRVTFVMENPAPGFNGGKAFIQNIAMVTGWTIINLDIKLKGMAAWAYWTSFLKILLHRSISGTCSFLDAQFRYIPRSTISNCRCSNSLSERMRVILKPRCR